MIAIGVYFDEKKPLENGSAIAWRLLRMAVWNEYGVTAPRAERTGAGKPYFPEMPGIHFSLSHCKTHVMCALSDRPVGADIETVRDVLPGVGSRIATEVELGQFDFFELWVLKEACVKLYGLTLRDMRLFELNRSGGAIAVKTPDGREVHAYLLSDAPGCRAAVAQEGVPPATSLS